MNGKHMASTSSSTAALEDHIVRERTKQIILQSMSFKTSLKVNCIMAVEVDEEPTRCVILNEVFSSADRARFVAQAPIPFLSLDPATYHSATEQTNGFLPRVSHINASTISSPEYTMAATPVKSESSGKTSRKDVHFSSTPSKRKAGRPCRIPPSVGNIKEESCNGALDLSKSDSICSNGVNLDESTESQTYSESLRNMLRLQQKLPSDPYNQRNFQTVSLSLSNSTEENSPNQTKEEIKTELFNNNNGGEKSSDNQYNSMLPVFPPVKVSYHTSGNGVVTKPKRKLSSALGGVITKRSGSSKVFACNQCKENFNSLTSLCKHTFSVHRAFRCTFCGANFTQRSNLQRHSLKHVGFKPFICNVCTKAYYRKDHLVRHIEVTHPHVEPKASITVKLTSSECLEYLEKMHKEDGSSTPVVAGSPSQLDQGGDGNSLHSDDQTASLSVSQMLGDLPEDDETMEEGIIDGEHVEIVEPVDVVEDSIDAPNDMDSIKEETEEEVPVNENEHPTLETGTTLKRMKQESSTFA